MGKLHGSFNKPVEYHPRDGDHDYKDDNPYFGLAMGAYSWWGGMFTVGVF